jgi:hypothetical protein
MPSKPKKVMVVYERGPVSLVRSVPAPSGKAGAKELRAGPKGRGRMGRGDAGDQAHRRAPNERQASEGTLGPETQGGDRGDPLYRVSGLRHESSGRVRDQKNPARRIEEIRKAFEGRVAAETTAPEIEDWLGACSRIANWPTGQSTNCAELSRCSTSMANRRA